MRTRTLAALALLGALLAACTSPDAPETATESVVAPFEASVRLASPDGQLAIDVGLDDLGRARYRVTRTVDGDEIVVVHDSTLGLEVTGGDGTPISLASDLSISDVSQAETVTASFDLPTGKKRAATIEARRQVLRFARGDATFGLELWVADTAAAFRYVIDESSGAAAPVTVEWERTSIAIAPDSRAWMQGHDQATRFTPAYERLRSTETTAGAPGRSQAGWTFPALFADDETWTLITESALADGDAGSHLSPIVDEGEYFIDLALRDEGNGIGDPRPVVALPWSSPWRIIVNSPDVADIVESDHVRFLSPGPDPSIDYSWVEPGRVSWSWWSDHESSQDADAIEPFIDLAAELGWEYSLVDANWDTFEGERLAALIDYATTRNVGLFLWYNSGGPHNVVTEAPRDRMLDPTTRRSEFARLAELGIRGVKVDFFHSDKPIQIQQYRDILTDAADFELLVNFHGSTVPRGWSAEFPHLMTMEAVRGAEIYTFDPSYAAAAPAQNTMLPFTRNVVGSMDYTPVILGDTVRRLTGNGHELALAVVFESGLQHFVDTPEAYLSQPDAVIDLLSSVPTVWDETRLLAGGPGSFVALARRHDDTWWIGAINGQSEPVIVGLDLEPLGFDRAAVATSICDDATWEPEAGAENWADPSQYVIITDTAAPNRLELPAFGGCLIRVG